MHPMLNIAIRAARQAGGLITQLIENNQQQSRKDFVFNVYKSAERLIIKIIRYSYPHHTVTNVEGIELVETASDIQWIIDPIDGTQNFMKNIPHFAISIAVRIKGCVVVSVIYDFIRNEIFTATRGQGARLNGYRLRSSNTRALDSTIFAISISFKQQETYYERYIALLTRIASKCTADLRRTGSAVLDLAYVAAGRIDGFFQLGLKDVGLKYDASGELLVREAGGLITDVIGMENYPFDGKIVAGNARLLRSMLYAIRDDLRPQK